MPTLIVGFALGLISGVALFVLETRRARLEAQRSRFAEALADVLRWREMPYRIVRRVDDLGARKEIADQMHLLQERLAFHRAWLQVENEKVSGAFQQLEAAVKEHVRDEIRRAWTASPAASGVEMNLDTTDTGLPTEADAYLKVVRQRLRMLQVRP